MAWILETLPEALGYHLLAGSEGAGHLAQAAAMAGDVGLIELARSLLLAAWLESPLDGALAGQVAASSGIPAMVSTLAGRVSASFRHPGELGYYRRLAERRDHAKIQAYLERERGREPENLFWTGRALTHAMAEEDWDWAVQVASGLPELLARLTRGDIALLSACPEQALAEYRTCLSLWEGPGTGTGAGSCLHRGAYPGEGPRPAGRGRAPDLNHQSVPAASSGASSGLRPRLAQALRALGEPALATAQLRLALVEQPWRVGALLALFDLETGRCERLETLPGSVAVLLYTYGKAVDLDRTLASLAASTLGGARLFVLDNGSPDHTPQVLAAWTDRLGPDCLHTIRLPVNIGAPAARNWLMRLPEVQAMDWSVYVDDDVSLPPEWLQRLGAAATLYPDAGVWGCRVRDFARPGRIQSADAFLVPLEGSEQLHARRFELTNCHHQTLDRGQFSYLRPCATVTGCCHLFRTATLAVQGGFDLRYSPSQYDDLDHDIRLLLAGRTPVYQGHLAVGHFKSTGSQGTLGQSQYAVGYANQFKLHHTYTPEQFDQAANTARQAAWTDALEKWRQLGLEIGGRP